MDGSVQEFSISVGELEPEVKEPVKFTWRKFFSADMTNWNQFDAWPSWSICAWFSWFGISIASLIAAAVLFAILKKIIKKVRK